MSNSRMAVESFVFFTTQIVAIKGDGAGFDVVLGGLASDGMGDSVEAADKVYITQVIDPTMIFTSSLCEMLQEAGLPPVIISLGGGMTSVMPLVAPWKKGVIDAMMKIHSVSTPGYVGIGAELDSEGRERVAGIIRAIVEPEPEGSVLDELDDLLSGMTDK